MIAKFTSMFTSVSHKPSKIEAKKRLKLLLIHDQIDLTPTELENLKSDILDVIRKYLQVDEQHSQFRLDRSQSKVTLVSSIPICKPEQRVNTLSS